MRRMRPGRVALVAICALGALGGCLQDTPDSSPRASAPVADVEITQSRQAPPRSSVAVMVRRVLPSVVNVRVRSFGIDEFGSPRQGRGEGSGVVIDRDGIILTNAHVVRAAVDVTVVFNDDHDPLAGQVIGAVAERDLAVIKVDATDLDPITLGHSEPPRLNLGDPVVAIGFPLGLGGPTVTKGIVSGLDRSISVGDGSLGTGRLEGLLQTDAAINPGNSGGALVNAAGQLVGINTAAALASSAENIGFAIAIDDALPVIEEILTKPRSRRAWLGVQVVSVDQVVAAQLGLPADARGAAVVEVIPGSPAEEVGIERGEVIVAVGGRPIDSAGALTSALTEHDPGDEVELELVSANARRTLRPRLARRPPVLPG
jgi:S1-C subfamily serine protease